MTARSRHTQANANFYHYTLMHKYSQEQPTTNFCVCDTAFSVYFCTEAHACGVLCFSLYFVLPRHPRPPRKTTAKKQCSKTDFIAEKSKSSVFFAYYNKKDGGNYQKEERRGELP
jgi:hypothetical protein